VFDNNNLQEEKHKLQLVELESEKADMQTKLESLQKVYLSIQFLHDSVFA